MEGYRGFGFGGGGLAVPVSAANGGTGQSSYTIGDLLYASSSTALSKLADVAVGQVLVSGGVGAAPAWSATPALTSIALGGATPGTNALAVAGTGNLAGTTFSATGGFAFNDTVDFVNNSTSRVANIRFGASSDTILRAPSAATLQLGNTDVDTAPIAQTLRTQGALAGGTSNVAGAPFTLIVSPSKGNVGGGSLIIQTTPAGSTGTVVNAPVTALTLDSTQLATFGGALSAPGSLTFTTNTSGIVLKRGANGLCGTFVANGATPVVVNNSNIAVTDSIIISLNTIGGTVGVQPHVSAITGATSFAVTCTAVDTSTYNYAIIKNAA